MRGRPDLLRLDCFLSLGSNLDPQRHLPAALHELQSLGRVVSTSSLWRTAAWGRTGQPDFDNLALCLRTQLRPLSLLERCQRIERRVGRQPRERWGPREIDIDLLFCRPSVLMEHPRLQLPHPRMLERAFVLAPLNELRDSLDPLCAARLRQAAASAAGQRIERLGRVQDVYANVASAAAERTD